MGVLAAAKQLSKPTALASPHLQRRRALSPGETPPGSACSLGAPEETWREASRSALFDHSFERVSVFAAERAQAAIARTPRGGSSPTQASDAASVSAPLLYVTEPGEPDEVEADRFASAAVDAMSQAEAALPQPSASLAPAAASPAVAAAPAALPSRSVAPAPAPAGREQASGVIDEPADERGEDPALVEAYAAGASGTGDDEPDDNAGSRSATPVERLFGAAVGAPLDASLRDRLEPVVGVDLSRVRIHADSESAALADRFQARAFAHRHDIFFAPGEYAPGTRGGMHLLLHEIAHVVQQSGAQPATGVVARAPLSGIGLHEKLQKILLDQHSDLIAEAVIPGGNTGGRDLDKVGYPDLYRSSAGNKVPWVRGEYEADGTLKYVPIDLGKLRRRHPHAKTGRSGHEPTVDANQTFTGDFPSEFAVAEIKPIGIVASAIEKAGEGFAQANNYLDGLPAFAKQARADKKTTVVPRGSSLTRAKGFLPPAIDYDNFQSDAGTASPAKPNLVFGDRRYWVYAVQKEPVLFYFDLPHPYAVSDYTKALDAVFSELEGLKRRLGKKQPATKLPLKAARPLERRQRRARAAVRVARATDWKAEHTAWEADRAAWDDKKAKTYLKTKEAKAVEEKAKVDRKIGLPASTDPQGAENARKIRQVELFSGRTGKILGDIRYALAPVFDKISPLFEWLKKKLSGLVAKFSAAKKLALSWVQVIWDAVVKALNTTVQEAVALLFGMFQDCVMGMIDHFIQGFVRDLTEELEKPFEEAKQAFFGWLGVDEQTAGQFVRDLEASIQKYEQIADAILDAKRIVDEIKVYEWVIRGIVEAISCVTPPALGCLWGLIANLALPEIVDLAITSDLFQDRVVRPLVRDLVKDILDEPFSRIVSASVEAIGLGTWAKAVPACKIKPIDVKKIIDRAIAPGLKLDDPALRKKRDAWENQHEGEILDAATKRFVKKDGAPATRDEVKRLVDQVKDLVPEAGTMQDAIAGATRPDGKIEFEKFADWAQGKVAAAPRPARAGGWTSDAKRAPEASQVKAKLDGLDLSKVPATRMVELLEDAREGDGRVNVDQFARKVESQLERQQIKREIEAQQPRLPGVPQQPDRDFVDPSGAAPSKDAMREVVDSLAKANLGEAGGEDKLEAARRPDNKVDVTALKAAVDAAAPGLPSTSGGPPGPAPREVAPRPEADKPRPPSENKPAEERKRCVGPFCVTTETGGGPVKLGPFDLGPETFPGAGGQPGTVLPGLQLPLGAKDKNKQP